MSNAEEGIAKVQAEAAKENGLQKHHKWSVQYLDERIFVYIFAIAFLLVLLLWLTSTSPLISYGSFTMVILIVVLWGVFRVKRIHRLRELRELQAKESQNPVDD